MPNRCCILLLVFISYLQVANGATDTFRVHADFPTIKDEQLLLDVFYASDSSFPGFITVQFYKYENGDDSLLVLNKRNHKVVFKKGVNKLKIDFTDKDSTTSYNSKFYEILKRTDNIAPGSYKVFISVKNGDKVYHSLYLHDVDSALSATSPVRQDINKSMAPQSKSFLGIQLKTKADKVTSAGAGGALLKAKNKIDKAAKKRGLTSVHNERNGKTYIDLYYADWFAGRYEAKNNDPLSKQVGQQEKIANSANMGSLVSNDIGQPSLFSQYKKLNGDKKDKDDVKGEIGLTTNISSGQEQYSAIDNNYYELRGRIDMPVCNIPVTIEGLYTSQDNTREIKSSYFKFHYDIDQMKQDLNKSMSSYNTKFAETKSKNGGMQQIYRTSISNLEGQKSKLENEVKQESNTGSLNADELKDKQFTSGMASNTGKQLKDSATAKQDPADSTKTTEKTANTNAPSEKATEAKNEEAKVQSLPAEEQRKIAEKKRKIDELNKKIEKYKILLAQYENTNHFDSLVGYNKTKEFTAQDGTTYKQMVKRSSGMLPDGQVKGFMAGVTTMDAGMFAKSESQFTMSGQMMKGVDFGYDLGFCETGVTVGKTEYIGRDGNLDKYTFYSGKASFKPAKAQKISLIYYGYTADHKMITGDAFFNNANISAPSFFQPVHIFSMNYEGLVSRYVTYKAEAATSVTQSSSTDEPPYSLSDKMAYHFNVDGNIPKTTVTLEGAYDKTGKGFQNNTLPVSMAGTEQYKLAERSDFFRSLLTAGVEYDRLMQTSFASNSASTKWGFDVKTNFKKYPNVAFSYKPFTTFHTYTDTLNVPQRPLLGSVSTGKASYRIKHMDRSVQFLVIYNKSMTTMDTGKYGSNLVQATTIYTDKILTASASIGHMVLTGTNVLAPAQTANNTSFLSLTGNYILNKKLSVNGGQDIGVAAFGFCRYSITGGLMYRPAKAPVTMRFNMRFNTYQLDAGESWKQIYSGNVDVAYRFKAKASKKNNF